MNKDLLSALEVTSGSTLKEALAKLERSGCGILTLVGEGRRFERTITDGDLRRLILEGSALTDRLDLLQAIKSHTASEGMSRRDALELMNRHAIHSLPVIGVDGVVVDVIFRRDIDEQVLLSTPHIGDAEREFVEQAFLTNWIAPLGPNVDAFETELCTFVGSAHGAAVSSGTAAIHLGLRLLGVGPGDRVFCSTLTFAASANPIVYQGAEPVFIDSEMSSWNMCPTALERAFAIAASEGWSPKAVIVVNLYGQSADMDPIREICSSYDVPILEDAAESLGATYKGRHSGTIGKIGIYSFNGNKIITTSGGGMLISDDREIVDRARFLATQARDPAPYYQHSEVGYNYRMSNILAGVGRGQLHVLKSRVERRRRIFDQYREGLAGLQSLEWMPEPEWSFSNRWLTTATISADAAISSTELIQRLASELIEARPVWKPMHLQPVFAGTRYFTAGNSSVSDDLFERGICLPSSSNMTSSQLDRVIDTIKRIFT
ncbi:aminotransferase class I/II-fold pyridoxal phosphate-dependent enzyme [Rhizobium wuzhouense]|uniref:Aminotransferase n=1 Tax=Rhizobium wuzhouense TaxID=1986026 RepID=A0ABX5NV92_9HYPH|nr:aminotransferase class I/II-fold pyridoxal phosphate-dependent enzyme [Rhizobium wuzhouense]PYB77092.1 aminotransferase [Rhizobium wuzhouense]